MSKLFLAGDIGGTKTNLALYSIEAGEAGLRSPLVEDTFPSNKYPSLEAVVQDFFGKHRVQAHYGSFGVAGPVVDKQATITNLPWLMKESSLAKTLNLDSVTLLNDLVSIAYAVPTLHGDDLYPLNAGQPVAGGSIAILAPGTGLGEAYLTWDQNRYHPHGSEGGHVDFAPTNDLETGLLSFLRQQYGRVSYERVCSGMGLPNIYTYLKESGYAAEPDWLTEALATAPDPTPIIVNTALDTTRTCDLCQGTLSTFISILGSQAGNMALNLLTSGGVYLGGGIPPRILPLLKNDTFMQAFRRKGRLSHVLSQMPVYVILNPKSALLGAAAYGLQTALSN